MAKHSFLSGVTGQPLRIWRVERLWELSKELPIKSVPISSLREFDEEGWFHSTAPTCRRVAMHARQIYEADLSYPIILNAAGEVMDGLHRIAKAWILGMEEIQAVQFEHDPEPDEIRPCSST